MIGERMIATGHEGEGIVPDRLQFQLGGPVRRQGHDRQLQLTGLHRAAGVLGVHETDVELYLGVAVGEALQRDRQAVQPDVVTGRQAQPAGHFSGQVAHRALVVGEVPVQVPGDIFLGEDSVYGKGVDVIELRRRMGEAARERIGTHFRNEDTVRKTIALYEELVPNPD